MSDDQKLEIEIGRRQVENGQTEDWETVLNKLSKKASWKCACRFLKLPLK